MKNYFKILLLNLRAFNPFKQYFLNFEYKKWEQKGKPAPPPHLLKQKVIKEYAHKLGYSVLVETGTYLGEMVEAQKLNFNHIISIELSQELYLFAKKRFQKNNRIKILNGDSGKILIQVVDKLEEPAIFWLDGHYSSGVTAKGDLECPIYGELTGILSKSKFNNTILIDDARCFIGENDYPTLDELTRFINKLNSSYKIEVKDDIIRVINF
jgi:hypothetical protein